MELYKFSYKEYENNSRYWELKEFKLNNINLIVGNNASGKTRTLNVINGFSMLLLNPKVEYSSGTYKGCFRDKENLISYAVEFKDGIVEHEEMIKNDKLLFNRNSDGIGEIYNTDIKEWRKFKIPPKELVASRRDEIQYPYLENLYQWASNTVHFRFSSEREKQSLAVIDSNKMITENYNLKETNKAIRVFKIATMKYKEKFLDLLVDDFNKIGYSISSVDTGVLHSLKVDGPLRSNVVGLRVKETDRSGKTDHHEMSDGMFRALSILIHYNYYILEKKNLNILIDDIGEGLDFERSSKLIKLLIEKSSENNIQLIMSTNDKFVMNNTNLEYWQVIQRQGGLVKMFNIDNSKNEFEEFRFTGLNNFDLFSTDYFNRGIE